MGSHDKVIKDGYSAVVRILAAHSIRQTIALIVLVVLVEGCSSSATIVRRSGPPIVGRIDYSDKHQLFVSGDDDGRYSIERADVVSIDHPGHFGTVLGSISSGVGVGFLLLAPLASDCSSRDPTHGPDCWNVRALSIVMGVTYLVVGVPILFNSLADHARSTAAATIPQPPLQPFPARLSPP